MPWPSELERRTGDRVVQGSNHAGGTLLRNFGRKKGSTAFKLMSEPGEVKYPKHVANV